MVQWYRATNHLGYIRRNILSKLSGRAQMILGSGLEKYQLILLETKDGLDAVADRGLGA